MRQSPSTAIGPGAFQRPNVDNSRYVPHLDVHKLHDSPSLLHSGAFLISNNMAASTGLVTPVTELPPNMMGGMNGEANQHAANTAMDYFDFDLSSFAMEGGLESTGITLDPVPEEIDLDAQIADQNRMMESRPANGVTEPIWSNNQDRGHSEDGFSQAEVITGQQLHEQVSNRVMT